MTDPIINPEREAELLALEPDTASPWAAAPHPWPEQIGCCPLVGRPFSAHAANNRNVAAANTRNDIALIAAAPELLTLARQQQAEMQAQQAEITRLRKLIRPEWFYLADYADEMAYDSVGEVLEEGYFWEIRKTGQHVVEISVATRLPSIWAAVRFRCECEDPEECECANEMIVTEHTTEEEARAALRDTSEDNP